jgi:hypothetical protein
MSGGLRAAHKAAPQDSQAPRYYSVVATARSFCSVLLQPARAVLLSFSPSLCRIEKYWLSSGVCTMAICPYCLESIKEHARKCPHCQSSLDREAADSSNATFIVDKGFLYYAKFTAGLLAIFFVVGVYFYGYELKDAIKKASDAKDDVAKTETAVQKAELDIEKERVDFDKKLNDLNEIAKKLETIQKDVEKQRDDVGQSARDVRESAEGVSTARNEVARLLESIRSSKAEAIQITAELREGKLSVAGEVVASVQRQKIQLDPARGKLWPVSFDLHFSFLDGSDDQKSVVRKAIDEWKAHVGIRITEVATDDAEIRISFADGSYSSSFIGTDALGVPKGSPTINYGFLKGGPSDENMLQALHEFGHALGLQHEFQNPAAGQLFSDFNKIDSLYGWSHDAVVANLAPLSTSAYPGSRPYDRSSVMGYAFPAEFYVDPAKQPRPESHLSASDIEYISNLYPAH